jgi:predicted GNAT family acetyltransferase
MSEVKLELNEKGQGIFYILEEDEKIAFLEISISGDIVIAAHTEVLPKAEGKGLAKQLVVELVRYAREHNLKVMPLCPYVHAQFKRHPEEFADIWKKTEVIS